MILSYHQQTVLALGLLFGLLLLAGLGIVYLLFVSATRLRRHVLAPPGSDFLDSSSEYPARKDPRVTPPATFVAYARRQTNSPRERIIRLMASGLQPEAIARELSLPLAEVQLVQKHLQLCASASPAADDAQSTLHTEDNPRFGAARATTVPVGS